MVTVNSIKFKMHEMQWCKIKAFFSSFSNQKPHKRRHIHVSKILAFFSFEMKSVLKTPKMKANMQRVNDSHLNSDWEWTGKKNKSTNVSNEAPARVWTFYLSALVKWHKIKMNLFRFYHVWFVLCVPYHSCNLGVITIASKF